MLNVHVSVSGANARASYVAVFLLTFEVWC